MHPKNNCIVILYSCANKYIKLTIKLFSLKVILRIYWKEILPLLV